VALVVKSRTPGGDGHRVPLDPLEQRLAQRIQAAIRAISGQFNVTQYAQAVQTFDPDLATALLAQVNIDQIGVLIEETLRTAIVVGGTGTAREVIRSTPRMGQNPFDVLQPSGEVLPSGIILPGPMIPRTPDVEFAITDPSYRLFRRVMVRAEDYARTRSSQLVREISDSNQLAIRRVIAAAYSEPATVDTIARRLESVIGLHSRYGQAVLRFEDRNFRSFIREGMDTDAARARASDMAVRYRNKLVRSRARTIARTELQAANNFSRIAGWQGSFDAGLLDARSTKRWITAPMASRYGPPCPICLRISGEEPVPWDGVFSNGGAMPPAHPNCRCTAIILPPSRGLTGLPSQDIGAWIDVIDEMEAEYLAEIS